MSNNSIPTAPLVLFAAAAGLVAGYVFANRSAGSAIENGEIAPGSTVAYIGSLQARIDALEEELRRSEARSSIRAPSRAPVGRDAEESGEPGADLPVPSSVATELEAADPARAAEVLAGIRDALERGDATALDGLAPSIAAQRAHLAPELAAMLDEADSLFAMERLAELLGLTGDPRGVEPLTRLLGRETSDAVRNAAIRSLGQIRDPLAVATLEAEFGREGGSPMPPSLAASSLGAIGTPNAVAALQAEIDAGSNAMVRTFALRALADLADPELGNFFFDQALREGVSDRYRVEAIEALGTTGDRRQLPGLEQVAFSLEWSRAVQEAAKQAMNRILGEVRYPLR